MVDCLWLTFMDDWDAYSRLRGWRILQQPHEVTTKGFPETPYLTVNIAEGLKGILYLTVNVADGFKGILNPILDGRCCRGV